MSFHLETEFPFLPLALDVAESHQSCQSPKARPGSLMVHGNVPSHHPIPGERRNVATPGWQLWKHQPFPSWNLWSCWYHLNSCSIMNFILFQGIPIEPESSAGGWCHLKEPEHTESSIHGFRFPSEFQIGVGSSHTQG